MKEKTLAGMPVSIEISGKCNAKCPYCAREYFKHRYSGENMSPELFEKILDHLLDMGISNEKDSPLVCLYKWGEAFLNPNINEILKILKKKKMRADISSNFIVKPKIDKENIHVIGRVAFSLSGFTQESYGKIHGANLRKTLENFDEFYKELNEYAPDASIKIAWHRYKFNENELWDAYKYFDRPGIFFEPSVAFLISLPEMINFAEGKLPKERLKQAEKEIFVDYLSNGLDYHKKKSENDNYCDQWNNLVIDETGQLLLCCGVTNHDKDYILGNVLEMSAKEIMHKKVSDSKCKDCISSGIPRALGPKGMLNKKPMPKGGKRNYFRLKQKIYITNMIAPAVGMIRKLPKGEHIIRIMRTIRDGRKKNNKTKR